MTFSPDACSVCYTCSAFVFLCCATSYSFLDVQTATFVCVNVVHNNTLFNSTLPRSLGWLGLQMARAMVLSVMEQSASRHGAASSSMAPVIPSPKRSDPCTSGVRRNVPCSSRARVVVLDDDGDQAGGQDECYRQAMANSLKDSMRRPSSSERTSNKDCSQVLNILRCDYMTLRLH